ncbi:hypothetical protein LIER_05239 [Lithospermum erythrorhizon]|uniref:Retrovirus-related Pol polyprotein from transposon RE1 n=1 Tax=Lithospermum erythrorhizon TaxID=34254 RepID=A0AAV3P2L0_LITER
MTDAKPVAIPLPSDWSSLDTTSQQQEDPSIYRRLIGRLLYLNFTRLDVTFAVNHMSQFMQCPTEDHMKPAMHIVRYLRGTISNGLFYEADSTMDIQGYCDVDWAHISGYAHDWIFPGFMKIQETNNRIQIFSRS